MIFRILPWFLLYFLNYTFIHQEQIKLIKNDSKDFYNNNNIMTIIFMIRMNE